MNKNIYTIKKIRAFVLDVVKDVSVEALNEVPEGFNNNIIWHLGHMIAAQQGICYIRAGLPVFVNERYIALYRPGTKPTEPVDANGIENSKSLLLTSLEQLETDYESNTFANYPAWTTRYGVELTSITDALEFLQFHEGYHSGFIAALQRLVHK